MLHQFNTNVANSARSQVWGSVSRLQSVRKKYFPVYGEENKKLNFAEFDFVNDFSQKKFWLSSVL